MIKEHSKKIPTINFKAFYVDAPRVTIYFDDTWFDSNDTDELISELLKYFNESQIQKMALYFTQEALAVSYITECQKYETYENQHLISGCTHIVYIDTICKCLTVVKDFNLCLIIDGEEYIEDIVKVYLSYNIYYNEESAPEWCYLLRGYESNFGSYILDDKNAFNRTIL